MKLGLALGGGAGLGWAHIGVLRAIAASPLEISAIAGTSIGAIVGASYAAGELDTLEELARSANFRTIVTMLDPTVRRGGIMRGRAIEKRLEAHLGDMQFADLPIPFAAIAADLMSGETIVMGSGRLVPAIRASMSLPGIFSPVAHNGRLLIDGGVAMPVPVGPARALAPDAFCLSINLQDDFLARARIAGIDPDSDKPPSSLAIVKASVGLSLRNLGLYSLALTPPDLALSLPVGHIDQQNFTRADELIAIGQRETEAVIPEILARLSGGLSA